MRTAAAVDTADEVDVAVRKIFAAPELLAPAAEPPTGIPHLKKNKKKFYKQDALYCPTRRAQDAYVTNEREQDAHKTKAFACVVGV